MRIDPTDPNADQPLPNPSETLPILDRIQRGDERAVNDLFVHYRPFLVGLVRLKTAGMPLSRLDQDDLVQKSMMGLLSYRHLFIPGREGELRALAVQIVTSKITDEVRYWKAKKRSAVPDPDETVGSQPARSDPTPSGAATRIEFVEQLRICLAKLPEQQRQVLVLRIQHRLSQESIASQLGKSVEAVQMIEQRARRSLRECMKASGGSTSIVAG